MITLQVEILSGKVILEGRTVPLTTRELEIVIMLALCGKRSANEIAETLWPDTDGGSGKDRLKVYVHRVRRRLGQGAIRFEGGRYSLADAAEIDVRAILKSLALASEGWSPDSEQLLGLACRLRNIDIPNSDRWAWFAPHARRLIREGRGFAIGVARRALARGEFGRTIAIVKNLIAEDTCDDEARELVIRAHLSGGEQGAAASEYRRYAADLKEELGVSPSSELRRLFALAS